MPFGAKAFFGAIPSAGIVFAYLGFEQADQLAGEVKDPQRNLPRAIILACCIGIVDLRAAAARVHRRDARTPELRHEGLRRASPRPSPIAIGPFAGLAGLAGLGWLAIVLRHRRVRLALRHRPDLQDLHLAGRLRPGQEPVLPADLRQGRHQRHPVGRADLRVPDRAAVPAAVPELALAGRPDHRRERADVRRGAAVGGRVPRPGSRGEPARTGCRPPSCSPRSRSPSPTCSSTGRASRWSGSSASCLVLGYLMIGISMAFDPQRPPLDWKSAVWLPVWLIGMGIISWQGQYSGGVGDKPAAADQHLPHRVLVGHPGRRRVQRGHLLLGDAHQAAAGGDARAGQQAGRRRGRTAAPPSATESASATTGAAPSRDGAARLWAGRDTRSVRHKNRCGPSCGLSRGGAASSGPATRPSMSAPGTGPKRRLSTAPASGLSDSSHQPPSTRRAARLTMSISGRPGCRASTIWPGRIRRVRRTSSQSPGRRAGSMDRSATLTLVIGQCTHPSRCRPSKCAGGGGSVGSAS